MKSIWGDDMPSLKLFSLVYRKSIWHDISNPYYNICIYKWSSIKFSIDKIVFFLNQMSLKLGEIILYIISGKVDNFIYYSLSFELTGHCVH